MYQALYRKWRPRSFDDVISQPHITTALRNQIREEKTAHAYLFTGSRGTGKTTCARILAKTVNCEHRTPEGNPCLECDICREAERGALSDIVEIDAASNNSVEDIRDLREGTVYLPERCRYKVYIIDEVHMLSPSAWGALLKVMEEPPEYVKFILATTEVHKVPATIISRCQRYDFHRIRTADIAARLEYLRNMMLLKAGTGQPDLLTCLPDELPRLEQLAQKPSLDTILWQIAQLQDCRERMQRNQNKRVELEMLLLQLAVPKVAVPVSPAVTAAPRPAQPAPQPAAAPQTTQSAPAAEPAAAEPEQKPLTAAEIQPVNNWADILAAYQAVNPAVSGSLAESSAYVAGNNLLIVAKNRFFLTLLKNKENALSLRETVKQFLGAEYNIRAKCSEPEEQISKAQNLLQKAMDSHLDTAVEE